LEAPAPQAEPVKREAKKPEVSVEKKDLNSVLKAWTDEE
jgi:hypothetical protein